MQPKTSDRMRQQGPGTGLADIRNKRINKEDSNTKKIIESKAPKKDKKEAILADARKKQGIKEEKRQDFKKRTAEIRAKREEGQQSSERMHKNPGHAMRERDQKPNTEKPATTEQKGPLRRQDMDPNRSVMVQRVNRQMANTGATREDARAAVVARRDARQQQLEKIQSEQGVGQRQARGIMKYGNKTAVTPEGGGPAVANYQLAKRVIDMAKNKGLTRKEASGVIASRMEARKTV